MILVFVVAENGLSMFIWIGHNVDSHWVQQVFGVQSVTQIDIDKVRFYYECYGIEYFNSECIITSSLSVKFLVLVAI